MCFFILRDIFMLYFVLPLFPRRIFLVDLICFLPPLTAGIFISPIFSIVLENTFRAFLIFSSLFTTTIFKSLCLGVL